MRTLPLSLLVLALACAGDEPPAAPTPDPSSLRTTAQGAVVGSANPEGGHAWLGIPFAKPPVGELRWRAPRAPAAWSGTREALAFDESCMQLAGPLGAGDVPEGEAFGSEDCLYLNVFAPRFAPDAVPRGDARLPVMVWIHGGGNTIGDARLYDGGRLAERGVVVVTVHYRLGVFGWFYHASLRGGDATAADASGNYGTLDLVRALAWVRENVAAFGGDPERVTIFGESAGGLNVFSLMLAPPAKGLFQRAIVQSGGLGGATRAEAENLAEAPEPGDPHSSAELLLALHRRAGAADRAAARAAVAAASPAETARFLRTREASEILSLFEGRAFGMYDHPQLVGDGHVLPEGEALAALRSGAYHRVPIILGSNRDETKLFSMFGSPYVSRIFGIPWRVNDPRRYELENEYGSLIWKAGGVDEPAAAMRALQGPSVFAYRFDWDDEPTRLFVDMGQLLGAAHGLEIPFVFGKLRFFGTDRVFDTSRQQLDLQLSDAMMSYWTEFAASGDPGRGRDGALPHWTPWAAAEGHKYVVLDAPDDGGIRMGSEPVTRAELIARVASDPRFESDAERCAVWGGFVVWGEEMTETEYRAIADGACAGVPLPE